MRGSHVDPNPGPPAGQSPTVESSIPRLPPGARTPSSIVGAQEGVAQNQERIMTVQVATGSTLIERFMPEYDFHEVRVLEIDAVPDEVMAAIRQTDLRDPVITTLFAVRDLPNRIARRRRQAPPVDLAFPNIPDVGPGWVKLGEVEGRELAVGAVGKFWRRDYGPRWVTGEEFHDFDEPGYAKLAVASLVTPHGYGRSILRYEARLRMTDEEAGRRFRRYWKVIQPGTDIIIRRALQRVKAEAEWRECLTGALADR